MDSLPVKTTLGQKIMLAFAGTRPDLASLRAILSKYRPAGFTLFRALNIEGPEQVRGLTERLQALAHQAGLPPLLIAADQEGGQLMAIGAGTQLPGNMALGATGDASLARRAGEVLGRELRALGINVNYAPSCDVNLNPANPVIGVRSFGENPQMVAELAAAMIAGIQSAGVAATAKHFPGHGDTSSDSHYGVPGVPHSLERLRQVELVPFAAAIRAGVKLVMTAHLAIPAIAEQPGLPATLSARVLGGLLRRELGFGGVIITDAMDMHAIGQGERLGQDAARAAAAGADLLLLTNQPEDHRRAFQGLLQAVQVGQLAEPTLDQAARRVLALKQWLASQPPAPGLESIACAAHQAVADEIAARSVTLVRDLRQQLPLRLAPGERLGVVLPKPLDLTPADTSSYIVPALAASLRRYHTPVEEYLLPQSPTEADITAVLTQVKGCRAVVVGTINAFSTPRQASLVREMLKTGVPVWVVALRLPYDLAAFPEAPAYLCTYSLLEPSMRALAGVLFGEAQAQGRLPVSIPGLPARPGE